MVVFAVGVVVLVGLALRVREFVALRSLWLDEVALYFQIKGRTFEQLFWTGVRGNQGAPAAYLLLTRLAILNISPLEVAVRIVAFIAGLGLLFSTAALAFRSFTDTCSRVVACVLIAGSPLLIFYSTEGKQYILDAFIASLIFLTCLRYEAAKVGLKTLLVVGVIVVWFAHSAALVLCACGSVLMLKEIFRKNYLQAGKLALIAGAWVASFAFHASTNMTFLLNNRSLYRYWGAGMAPWDEGLLAVLKWSYIVWFNFLLFVFAPTTYRFGVDLRVDEWMSLWVFLLVVGMFGGLARLWRDRSVIAPYITALFVVVFSVAACRFSPLSSRIVLYLVPCVSFCHAALIGGVFSSSRGVVTRVMGSLTLFMIVAAVPLLDTAQGFITPHARSDMRGAVSYLAGEREMEEPVLIRGVDVPTFMLYARRYKLSAAGVGRFPSPAKSMPLMQVRIVKSLLESPTKSVWIVGGSRAYQVREALDYLEAGCCTVVKRHDTQGAVVALVVRKDRRALLEQRALKSAESVPSIP